MIIKHKVTMDMVKQGITPKINVMQGDAYTRQLELALYAGGVFWTVPRGVTVCVRYRNADGSGGAYDTLPDGSSAFTSRGNTVTVTVVPEALTVPGTTQLSVSMILGQQELSTFEIHLKVQPTPSAAITSDGSYFSIAGMLPAPETAQEGQLLIAAQVDKNGRITKVATVSQTGGKSAYEYARDGGYTGTEAEFAAKLAAELPTRVSELENDAGYLTTAQINALITAQLGVIENGAY